jgi:hypothetical protein
MAYMTYLSESPETYAVPAQGLAEQVTLTGRGLAFPSVRAALWAIGSVHEDLGWHQRRWALQRQGRRAAATPLTTAAEAPLQWQARP